MISFAAATKLYTYYFGHSLIFPSSVPFLLVFLLPSKSYPRIIYCLDLCLVLLFRNHTTINKLSYNRATLDSLGASMEVAKYTERLVPSSRIVSVDGVAPALPGANNFIAPSASVIGNVTIGEHSR